MRKYLFLILGLFILVGSVNALDTSQFDFTYPDAPTNYSEVNTNHSLTSDTATTALNWFTSDGGLLGDVGDILGSLINNDLGWITQTDGNSWWCKLTGCTMAGDIDMGGNDIDNIG